MFVTNGNSFHSKPLLNKIFQTRLMHTLNCAQKIKAKEPYIYTPFSDYKQFLIVQFGLYKRI